MPCNVLVSLQTQNCLICQIYSNSHAQKSQSLFVGFLLKHEADILSESSKDGEDRWSLRVINWALILVREARDNGMFENPSDATRLLDPIIAFKKSCSVVLKYQITAIPLSFVQVSSFIPQIIYLTVFLYR